MELSTVTTTASLGPIEVGILLALVGIPILIVVAVVRAAGRARS